MPTPRTRKLPKIDLGSEPIHERIARLRKQQGLTQAQLAKKTGFTQGQISAFENGARGISAELAARLAIALDVTTDELIGLNSKKNGKSYSVEFRLPLVRRMKKIQDLPKRRQKEVLQGIDLLLKGAANK